nr:hypothetical protein [Legionella jordanis]
MLANEEVSKVIARDKMQLTQFILDLCGFTLDEAGYDSKSYAFYLHVAFRHQAVLQSKEWSDLCTEVLEKGHGLDWDSKNEELYQRIVSFAQSIVTEVTEASQDNWAVKLIKTSYLSRLDKARRSCEHAIRFINAVDETQSDVSVSQVLGVDAPREKYTEALKAQRAYMDSLLALPFVLEKTCLSLAKNTGVHYQPRKSAEMLAAALDCMNQGMKLYGVDRQDFIIKGLKIALDITMPNVQGFDAQLQETITSDLLPFINKILDAALQLEEKKKAIFPSSELDGDEISLARKRLLATLGVNFESLQTILLETLLIPAQQCSDAVAGVFGLAQAAVAAAQNPNPLDRVFEVKTAFSHFDRLSSLCNEVDPALLPAWLVQTNNYYQDLRGHASNAGKVVQVVVDGLGVFYNYALSFIPQSVRHYVSRANALTRVFQVIDNSPLEYKTDKLMAYFAFYELAKTSEIEEVLKERFFAAYMDEVVKSKPDLVRQEFLYKNYLAFEAQMNAKFNLATPLNSRIANYPKSNDMTASLISVLEENVGSSDLQKLDVLMLLYRLQHLESQFELNWQRELQLNNFGPIFKELAAGAKQAKESPHPVHQAFQREFLNPAIQRMVGKYQEEKLVPALESMLDSRAPSLGGHYHKLRSIYSKLREDIVWSPEDWRTFKECCRLDGKFQWAEFQALKVAALELGNHSKKEANNNHWLTPRENLRKQTEESFETVKPVISNMLKLIQERLDEQELSCKKLQKLSKNNDVLDLCQKKISYINALNQLINALLYDLEHDQKLRAHISTLLSADAVQVTQEELLRQVNVSALGKLLRLAWNALPNATNGASAVNDNFVFNLLKYYFADSVIGNVLEKEQAFASALDKEPIPALIAKLNDPLAESNLLPSQEKIMDALVNNMINVADETIIPWGANYLANIASKVVKQNLAQLLPYPFLVNLAMVVIQSETVQEQIAPIFNDLMSEYSGIVLDKASEFKEEAKKRLYPVLGIEIQRTLEESALHYAQNPEGASDTERDAFIMYYLQYQQIKLNNVEFNAAKTIEYLFPQLLRKKTIDINGMVDALENQFKKFDQFLPSSPDDEPAIAETESQLVFLISHIDLSDPDNDKLVKLALINRILIMAIDTAEQISNPEKIMSLQQTAIQQMAAALEKIKVLHHEQLVEQNKALAGIQIDSEEMDDEGFIMLNAANKDSMYETLAVANTRIRKMQLKNLKTKLAETQKLVSKEMDERQAMLDSKEPLLGISIAEWEYHKSKPIRLLYIVLSNSFEVFSLMFTWLSLLLPILAGSGVLEGLLTALGVTGAIGATATPIGAIIFGVIALARISYKLGMEIWNRRDEFTQINQNPSFWRRAGLTSLLLLKCLGLAIAKTLLTDYLVAELSTYFAFGPFERLRNAFRIWPSRERVSEEQRVLNELKTQMSKLNDLIDEQNAFLDGKAAKDCQAELNESVDAITKSLKETRDYLNQASFNDARRSPGMDFQLSLEQLDASFNSLKQEVMQLSQLNRAQSGFSQVVDNSEKPLAKNKDSTESTVKKEENRAAIVDLEAYRKKLDAVKASKSEQTQSSYLSRFWNWFAKPQTTVVAMPPAQVKPLEESLSVSSVYMIPPNKDLTLSEMMESFVLIKDADEVGQIIQSIEATTTAGEKEIKREGVSRSPYKEAVAALFFNPAGEVQNSKTVEQMPAVVNGKSP